MKNKYKKLVYEGLNKKIVQATSPTDITVCIGDVVYGAGANPLTVRNMQISPFNKTIIICECDNIESNTTVLLHNIRNVVPKSPRKVTIVNSKGLTPAINVEVDEKSKEEYFVGDIVRRKKSKVGIIIDLQLHSLANDSNQVKVLVMDKSDGNRNLSTETWRKDDITKFKGKLTITQ